MSFDEHKFSGNGGRPAAQAYWNALRKLREAWREVFDEDLEGHGSRAMESFENALANLKLKLQQDTIRGKRVLEILDIDPKEDIGLVLLGWADLEDVSPKAIKEAIKATLRSKGTGRFELRPILRTVLDAVFDHSKTRRPRVGPNRHWPRLLQYLRELEFETDWSPDGRGVKLANASGRGRVARSPSDPSSLSIVVDVEYL